MEWNKLFAMQKELDSYIEENKQLTERDDLFTKKILALLVELGELANETRCFKFWSSKASSERSVILEEYVDGVHFILSLGIEKGFTIDGLYVEKAKNGQTEQFLDVFEKVLQFQKNPNQSNYNRLMISYLQLGELLGFSEDDVQQAYVEKNEVNFARQDQGY